MIQLSSDKIRCLLDESTSGPWTHCQPFETVLAVRTIHGFVAGQRVDYVASGKRVIVPMQGTECNVKPQDMALIAAAPDLAAEVIRLRAALNLVIENVEATGSLHADRLAAIGVVVRATITEQTS